jgi:arsenate reductase
MRELGIDISGHRSKSIDEFADQNMDYVITVCDQAAQHCPQFPAVTKHIHWSVEDPVDPHGDEEAQVAMFRKVRDDLRRRLKAFVAESDAEQRNEFAWEKCRTNA